MKSRQKKYIRRLMYRAPFFAFSYNGDMKKKSQVQDLSSFHKVLRLDNEYIETTNYKKYIAELFSHFIYSFDHHMNGDQNRFVYLLVPTQKGYRIAEKESIRRWADAHWRSVDPNNERKWKYFDEDTADLFNYMVRQFDRKCL